MKRLDDSALVPELGLQVLKILSRHQALPSWGLLAGQAVASAIDEALGTGTPVYNDIDWFVPTTSWVQTPDGRFLPFKGHQFKGELTSGGVQYRVQEEVQNESYSRQAFIAERLLYTVKHSETHGLLNKVAVAYAPGCVDDGMDLIRVFDTNNVQACVDLCTGRLTVSPAYREFFRTRQLKLAGVYTPVQSLLRFLRKADELKGSVYADRDSALDLVHRLVRINQGRAEYAAARRDAFLAGHSFIESMQLPQGDVERQRQAAEGLEGAPLCFGKKYIPQFQRYASVLEPVFELTERKQGSLWLVTARQAPPARTFWLGEPLKHYFADSVARFHEQQVLRAGKQLLARRALFTAFLGRLTEAPQVQAYQREYLCHGDGYLAGFDSEQAMVELARLVKDHHEFYRAACGLPLAEQVMAMRLLRSYFKKYDMAEAWGVLNTVGSALLRRWLKDTGLVDQAFNELANAKEPYVDRLPLPTQVGDVHVYELVSQIDLLREGSKMRHCVSGYGPSLQSLLCRLISFRAGPQATDCATAEWRFEEDQDAEPIERVSNSKSIYPLKVRLEQLRSFANGKPNPELVQAEAAVRQQFNDWLRQNPMTGWSTVKPGRYEVVKSAFENDQRKKVQRERVAREAQAIPF